MPNLITKIRFFFYIRRRLLRCRKKQLTIAGLQIILLTLASLILLFQNNDTVYSVLYFSYVAGATILLVYLYEGRGGVYSICQSYVLLCLTFVVSNHLSRLFIAIPLYIVGLLVIVSRRKKFSAMYMDYRFRDAIMNDIAFTSSLYNEEPSGKRALEVLMRRYTVFACILLIGIMLIPSPPLRPVAWEKGFDKNVDTFLLFREGVWEDLTDEERLAAMQCAADVQNAAFGLPKAMVVEDRSLFGSILGTARGIDHEIHVYLPYFAFNKGEIALNVINHECRHLYQYSVSYGGRVLDCYPVDPDTIEIWKYEFDNYIDCNVNEDGYNEQMVEIDADEFAENQTKLIIDRMNEYLNPS